jgi:ABC-type dipeptide/oligopeptide/nickel transport system ATPase component
MTVGEQIGEGLVEHMHLSKSQARKQTLDLLEYVGIPDPQKRIENYPHQFSGGMRQRVMIAIAIGCMPKILIADEPTTALMSPFKPRLSTWSPGYAKSCIWPSSGSPTTWAWWPVWPTG